MTKSINIVALKEQSAGRWRELLSTLGGVSADVLDGKNHPCPRCGGTDRFRMIDVDEGALLCNKCFRSNNGDGIAALQWLNGWSFPDALQHLGRYLGIDSNGNGQPKPDTLGIVAALKRVSVDSLKAYGATLAHRNGQPVVRVPCYNEAGEAHSYFDLGFSGDRLKKGMFRKGKGSSGLFFPGRLPAAGERWILCEGVKDACAYHAREYLACGLNTDQMAVKYARLFRGVNIIVMPDRTADAEAKAQKTAGKLHGVAASVRIGTLPLEIGGDADDARDVLKLDDGEALLRQAIADAVEWQPRADNAKEWQRNGDLIVIRPNSQPVAEVVESITNCLLAAGQLFVRTDQPVIIRPGTITPILNSRQLSGIINEFAEVLISTGEESSIYRPLPTEYGNVWLNRISVFEKLPKVRIFTRNPIYTADFRLAKPGFDPDSGIYYDGVPIVPSDNTHHLDELLQDFCWKTPGDRTNYIGILLTALLISKFIGSKPAVVFNGNQPELGKSILAQIIAIIRDGVPVETATYNPNDEEFEKRLGSIVRRGNTTIIIDNAKARGRVITIESAVLERSITDPILSFRLLGGSTDIRCENSHIFCITANTPEIGRDLITRSIIVSLYYEGDPTARAFRVVDPEGYASQYRVEVLSELCGMVERWKASGMPLASTKTRFNKKGWGNIIGGNLDTNGQPGFLKNASEAAEQMDAARREFGELVEAMSHSDRYYWTSAGLVKLAEEKGLLRWELGDGSARSKATRMGILTTRYIAERFELEGSAVAIFRQREGRRNREHFVEIEEDELF